jgi:amidase/aspartyl-tRNA(Asn)/glutamyl-tRNA(Gln) amidotransferase subunit A
VKQNLARGQRRAVLAQLVAEKPLAAQLAASTDHAGPLAGVPYFLKDLFDLAGMSTGAGSCFLPTVRAPAFQDAAIVRDLREAGALCAGKTQLHEFAYGLTGENPHHGDCSHPLHPARTTGGSSSGSAATVAAGIVPFSIGTDTGGSVRVPAAFCGLYGFRGTPGHHWIRDAFPLAPSCDTAGWFARSAGDLALLNRVLLGSTTARRKPRVMHLALGKLDPEVEKAFTKTANHFSTRADPTSAGQLTEAFKGAGEAYTVLTSAEAAEVHEAWLDVRKTDYSEPVWKRIDRGRQGSRQQALRALMARQRIRDAFAAFFLCYDALVIPATPCPALRHEACATFDRNRILELTAPASLAGLPVLSIPAPLPGSLTTGLQVIVNSLTSPVIEWVLGLQPFTAPRDV